MTAVSPTLAANDAAGAEPRPPLEVRRSLNQGSCDSRHLMHTLRGADGPADAFFAALERVRAAGDPDRLRGLCRELQRRLERIA